MEDDSAVIYGLEFQARALTAQTAETDNIRFLVGTQSLKFENQIHLVDFDDDNNTNSKNIYLHKEGEIWNISSSTSDSNTLATCYNNTNNSKAEMQAAVWKLPAEFDNAATDDDPSTAKSLNLVSKLIPPNCTDTKRVLWHPFGEGNEIISLADSSIFVWDLEISSDTARVSSSTSLEVKGQPKFSSGQWNPHHNCKQIATTNDTSVRGWDLRSMKQVYHIENAHSQLVRDLDFNPNRQYYLATCGDDCKAKFWDIRDTTQPLKVITDHSHWLWSVRFNRFHDQLVLTSSSDSRVILSNTASISSEPFGHLADDEDEEVEENDEEIQRPTEVPKDGIINIYEEHEDSVYAAEWSTADPWVFASLSYDGRLVINRVPRATKYQILL